MILANILISGIYSGLPVKFSKNEHIVVEFHFFFLGLLAIKFNVYGPEKIHVGLVLTTCLFYFFTLIDLANCAF